MRIIFYVLLIVIIVGLGVIALLFAAPLWEGPPARMYWMGIPMMSLPLAALASLMVALSHGVPERFSRLERLIALAAGAIVALPFPLLFLLG